MPQPDYFMGFARHAATASKDSTQVGVALEKVMDWNKYFYYDSGKIYHRWRENCPNLAWNSRYANKAAGNLRNDGYVRVTVEAKKYYVQVIVWEMHNGKIPEGYDVDHINLNRADNRIENMRLALRSENKANAVKYRTNTSGAKGVFVTKSGKYQVAIGADRQYVGQFNNFEDAVNAYNDAATERWGEFSRHNNV